MRNIIDVFTYQGVPNINRRVVRGMHLSLLLTSLLLAGRQ